MNMAIEAKILAWVPESSEEKTRLLVWHVPDSAESLDQIMCTELQQDALNTDEPGFTWSEEPNICIGLCIWTGVIESDLNAVHFAGKWSIPTVDELRTLSGLDLQLRVI